MLSLSYRTFELHKRIALAISRGKASASHSVIIKIESDSVVGLGEAAEFDIPNYSEQLPKLLADINTASALIEHHDPFDRIGIETTLLGAGIGSSVRNAVNMALFDWAGKVLSVPVWKLLGIDRGPKNPISVTVGINTPQGAVERLNAWFELGTIRGIKVKMGSPAGIKADQDMMEAIRDKLPAHAYVGVDANGGWRLDQAIEMSKWLGSRGVVHIEQPLAPEAYRDFPELFKRTQLPVFLDESCCSAKHVLEHGRYCHGVNIKLTKCGGLNEALRMITIAKSMNLQTMIGCYGNTALGNAAAHQFASMLDYIDLDSHLNLLDDPTTGLEFRDGYLVNSDRSGLGVDCVES
ncbi:MAG: mandelate racemase/muconate lactonizing enzyme family protein [Pirellula sp.]|jgi:L-alanine-DL-glutamate epimerase-like enolase superfamily enzyme